MTINIDPKTKERIYELRCECGTKGGEVRFLKKDKRTDKELERFCLARYSHTCDICCCKHSVCEKHKQINNNQQ